MSNPLKRRSRPTPPPAAEQDTTTNNDSAQNNVPKPQPHRHNSTGTEVVRVNDVVKSFPVGDDEITILKGISLSVNTGEFVSIVGPSGNGKSTLLNMITGIDRPSSGEIIVTDRPVHSMSENQLAVWRGENVGIIFQFFQMLPALSLLQNIILPMDFAKKYSQMSSKLILGLD